MVGQSIVGEKMAKKHKHKNPNDIVMDKLGKVRAKTGRFVDWQKVDEVTMTNSFNFFGLLKNVWNIAIGRKDEKKT